MYVHGEIVITGTTRVLAFTTTTPLAANGVYTSPTIDAINYKAFSYLLTSDQAGSFFIQYSDDGTNWMSNTPTATALAANAVGGSNGGTQFLRYVRAVYTNGATAQGSFKFSFYLSPL